MKKLIVLISLLFPTLASAETYIEEVRALGAVAGQGMACGAEKYDTFELLARAILISKASSDSEQAGGMKAYNDAKANAYVSKQMDGFYECPGINKRFNSQDIFKATLYGDGTLKMPDGKIITPRRAYDATLIYDKGFKEKESAQKIYSSGGNQKVKVEVRNETSR